MNPLVTIILLNYNGIEDTMECLDSLCDVTYDNYNIIIIDNGSENNETRKIQEAYPAANVIANDKNLGFTGGNNIGMRLAIENGADFVLLLNNDTLVDKKFLSEMIDVAEKYPKAGIFTPKIYNYGTNIIQSIGQHFYSSWGFTKHRFGRRLDTGAYDTIATCNFITGTAMLIRKSVIEKIGVLDENYFFYNEDVDYSINAIRNGYDLLCVPKSKVWHKTTRSVTTLTKMYFKLRNMIYLMRKFNLTSFTFLIGFVLFYVIVDLGKNIKTPIKGLQTIVKAIKDGNTMAKKAGY